MGRQTANKSTGTSLQPLQRGRVLGMVKEAGGKHRGPRNEGDCEVQGEEARAAKPPSLPRGSGGADAERRGTVAATGERRGGC